VASYWRRCAVQAKEPWRTEMMRDTAAEFEKAAASVMSEQRPSKVQTPADVLIAKLDQGPLGV